MKQAPALSGVWVELARVVARAQLRVNAARDTKKPSITLSTASQGVEPDELMRPPI